MPLGHARILIAGAFAGVLAMACDVHGVSAPGTVVSLTISANVTLTVGSTQQMTALGYDADGRSVPVSPTWTIGAGGGTISPTGMFSAGTTAGWFANTVVASVGRISANASVTVTPGALASIAVGPGPAVTLAVGGITRFIAVGMDAWGNDVPITPTWSVVAGGGTITPDGSFCAGGALGTFPNTVQASSQGVKAFTTVNVTVGPLENITLTPNPSTLPVGAKLQFTLVGTDASGNTVPVDATWAVVAYGGTIDQAGLFTAGTVPGTFPNTIEATSGTLSVTATVTVTAGPLTNIRVTPNPAMMTIYGTQQLTAVGSDIGGNPVAITPTWAVIAGGGSISAAGLFTAGTVSGTFTRTVRVTSGGLSGFSTVIVATGPLASITVTPNPVSVQSAAMQRFVAVGMDAGGNDFLITPVWSVVNGGGSINRNTGVFTASATPGTFTNTIQAASGTVTGAATVMVTAVPPMGTTTTFDDFNAGEIDGQHDWKSLGGLGAPPPVNPLDTHCRVYDHEIADNAASSAYLYPAFGSKSLRISNAVTYGCYADQTFSSRTANPAGQAGARSTNTSGSLSFALAGGVLQNHFEAEWSFASTVPDAQQPGLQVVVSPARGDDLRMSYVQMSDLPDGIAVIFGEWVSMVSGSTTTGGAPLLTTIAQGLDRHVPHTIEISMDFVDGPNNDVVQVFVDGVLRHTGTSWENYYYYDAGGQAKFGGAPPIVNRLMFRTGSDVGRGIPGDPAPATRGHGFVFDNVRQATFTVATITDAGRDSNKRVPRNPRPRPR